MSLYNWNVSKLNVLRGHLWESRPTTRTAEKPNRTVKGAKTESQKPKLVVVRPSRDILRALQFQRKTKQQANLQFSASLLADGLSYFREESRLSK